MVCEELVVWIWSGEWFRPLSAKGTFVLSFGAVFLCMIVSSILVFQHSAGAIICFVVLSLLTLSSMVRCAVIDPGYVTESSTGASDVPPDRLCLRKLFLLSLYYGFLLSVLVVLTAPKALRTMVSATTHSETPPEALYVLYLIICFVVFQQSAIYSVATFSLAAFQTFLVKRDETTIEFRRLHGKARKLLRKADALFMERTLEPPLAESFMRTYTTEENENQPPLDPNEALLNPHGFKEVFGSCVALWFLPIFPDELRTETSYDELPA
ncbi:hypothetical protein NDN08_007186 [Rhodosorus marinus]|uniref:Protein S-acyltransferase n=1 Tax=Rhodosorus marinus TaxID=101924 RepID=A0AAV8UFT0_9RHOD|nr:hypothetical protein NDN08_007186 [Rhodosorus marinus]